MLAPMGTYELGEGKKTDINLKRFKFYIVDDPSKIEPLSTDSFPRFYFLKKGKVVSMLEGWPGEDRLKEVKKGLKSLTN